ncbi:PTS cellobiose transporter subunit IIC, partial [Staphylococcus lugdunensis]|nr:PTS cellobiose transporter subunit IIC [Staphylococcus lugdunensis]
MSNKLAPFGEKVAAQRHLKALREGVLMAMPLVLIGSIFTLIGSFPIEAWTKWLHTHGELDALLSTMANNSFGLIGLATAFGI